MSILTTVFFDVFNHF